MTLGRQVYVAQSVPGEWPPLQSEHLRPIDESLCGWYKPHSGGLWTSSLTTDGRSGWIDWCLNENFEGPEFDIWHLDPNPAASVYTIDTYNDLAALASRFPPACDHPKGCPTWGDGIGSGVGWRRVAKEYDAVRVTEEGEWKMRLSDPISIYGWDCESTVWFRWKFLDVRHVGVQRFERLAGTATSRRPCGRPRPPAAVRPGRPGPGPRTR